MPDAACFPFFVPPFFPDRNEWAMAANPPAARSAKPPRRRPKGAVGSGSPQGLLSLSHFILREFVSSVVTGHLWSFKLLDTNPLTCTKSLSTCHFSFAVFLLKPKNSEIRVDAIRCCRLRGRLRRRLRRRLRQRRGRWRWRARSGRAGFQVSGHGTQSTNALRGAKLKSDRSEEPSTIFHAIQMMDSYYSRLFIRSCGFGMVLHRQSLVIAFTRADCR